MSHQLQPQDAAERIAIFRAQMVGRLLYRKLARGELLEALTELSQTPVLPPGSASTRTYSVTTLRRWYSRFRKLGLDGLKPRSRSQGFGLKLDPQQRELLCNIRRARSSVSATVLLRTLEADGLLPEGLVSVATIRRLLAAEGLDRQTLRQATGDKNRRARWEAECPGSLWHADVCHGPAMKIGKRSVPLRIHAILDDSSRYIVGIQACDNEREVEMLLLLAKALRCAGPPKVLFLDNGSTYSGEALLTACSRLGMSLVHAKPYDPQARGKMERFWRTLREGCLDHIGHLGSLHDVQVRLLAFVDQHYHHAAHAGLMGKTPAHRWETMAHAEGTTQLVGEQRLAEAFTVRGKRRIKRDGTLTIGGVVWECDQGYLAGRNVTVARNLIDPNAQPVIEHAKKILPILPVDVQANAKRPKPKRRRPGIDVIDFDPASALLRQLLATPKAGKERV